MAVSTGDTAARPSFLQHLCVLWNKSHNGGEWEHDFNVTYTRVTGEFPPTPPG